jgi:hypothetical protein
VASACAVGQDPGTENGHPTRVRTSRSALPQVRPHVPLLAAPSIRAAVPVPGPVRACSWLPGPVAAPAAIPGAGLFLLRLSLLSLLLIAPSFSALASAAAPPASVAAPSASAAVKPPEPGTEEQKQAEAEAQKKAEAERQKKAAAEKQKMVDAEKQKKTMGDIRNLGTALFSWLTDQVENTVAEQDAEHGAAPPRGTTEDAQQKTIDIQDYPLISREDLEDFLVPQYLAAIPETDAWGNPYEVRLNTDNLMAKAVMSIRSPGRKGYYAGDVYKIESFDPAEVDQDIVWADGYFVRWPQAATPAGKPLPIPPSGQR